METQTYTDTVVEAIWVYGNTIQTMNMDDRVMLIRNDSRVVSCLIIALRSMKQNPTVLELLLKSLSRIFATTENPSHYPNEDTNPLYFF